MTRDEVRVRSEGALDVLEAALGRCRAIEKTLRDPTWLGRVRLEPSVLRDEIVREDELARAVARLDKLEPSVLEPLAAARKRLSRITRRRLRDLDVQPRTTRLEDLLSQLLGRALDMRREDERIRRGWAELDRRDRLGTIGQFLVLPLSAAAGLYAASAGAPIWVAFAFIGIPTAVFGWWNGLYRPWRCPNCQRRLNRDPRLPCARCGHTRPRQ